MSATNSPCVTARLNALQAVTRARAAFVVQGAGEPAVQTDIVGVQLDGLRPLGDGLIHTAAGCQGLVELAAAGQVARTGLVEFDGLAVFDNGLVQTALAFQGAAKAGVG